MDELIKKPRQTAKFKSPQILQVFLDADLRSAHDGLTEVAKKHGLNLKELTQNQFVVFVNKAKTIMKCFVAGNTIAHIKRDRIDLEVISNLPIVFGAVGELDYDAALAESLRERLDRKRS